MRNQIDRFSLNLKNGFFVGLAIILILSFPALGFTQEKVSSDRPNWTHKTTFEKDGHIYFTGGFLNGADFPLSIM